MPEFSPQLSEPPEHQELFTLLSRQHDGDLGPEESERLAMLEAVEPQVASVFRQQVGELSLRMKQISVRPIGRLLFELPATTSPRANVLAEAPDVSRRSGAQRAVVGFVTSMLCAGLLFALTRRTETTDPAMLAKVEVRHGHFDGRGAIGETLHGDSIAVPGPMVSGAMQMKVAADLPPGVLMGAAASENAVAEGGAIPESSSESDVQPLIQSDDWNVVVVRIDASERDQAMDQIQSIVKKAGLQLKGSAGHDESRWLGVVLTSNLVGREDVVNAMEGVGASNGHVTEGKSDDSQEAIFIAAARESLKHPTRSELHHGKVFVALPSPAVNSESQIVADARKAAPGDSEDSDSGQAGVSAAAIEDSTARSAKVAAQVVPSVTLVVFEFSEAEKSGPNSSGQQI
jgi:hypothetical protein